LKNALAFDFFQSSGRARCDRLGPAQILGLNLPRVAAREDDRALDQVLQLANVAKAPNLPPIPTRSPRW